MRETEIDFKIGDDYANLRENFRDDALNDFYRAARKKIMQVEHLVPNDREGELVYKKNKQVAKAIDHVLELSEGYIYETEVEGKYGTYDEEFSYNFEDQARDLLADDLGYYEE